MLKFGDVTIEAAYEPPRPTFTPRRRVQVLRPHTEGNPEYREDWGLQGHRTVRFVSSEKQGFVTPDQVADLLELYESGVSFELVTDLLGPLGSENVTYVAYFDPETAPSFAPATPDGTMHYMDIVLHVN